MNDSISDTAKAPMDALLIDTDETCRLLGGMPRRSYQRMRSNGRFGPKAVKIGRRTYHRLDELRDWTKAGCPPAAKWEWRGA